MFCCTESQSGKSYCSFSLLIVHTIHAFSFDSDDNWGTSDAKVACRMLGFNTSTSYNSVARTHSTFGSGQV